MPSARPERKLRASQESFDVWDEDAATANMSFNAWAVAALEYAHESGLSGLGLEADVEQFAAWDAAAAKSGMSFNAWAVERLDAAASGDDPSPAPGTPPASEPTHARAPATASEPHLRRAPRSRSESAAAEVAAPSPQSKRSYKPDWKPEKRKKG